MLLMLFGNSLFAQTETLVKNDSIKFKYNQTFLSISPLLSPRVCVGINFAKQNNEQHWIESSYYIHGFYSVGLKNYGVTATYNYFWGATRKGYFTQLSAGIDYVEFDGFFYSTESGDRGLTPNLSGGFGYSFQVGANSYLRLSMDLGYKWLLSNIYVSYVW